eukprot:scaffold61279_cov73-Attheya_sp.AAC.1
MYHGTSLQYSTLTCQPCSYEVPIDRKFDLFLEMDSIKLQSRNQMSHVSNVPDSTYQLGLSTAPREPPREPPRRHTRTARTARTTYLN